MRYYLNPFLAEACLELSTSTAKARLSQAGCIISAQHLARAKPTTVTDLPKSSKFKSNLQLICSEVDQGTFSAEQQASSCGEGTWKLQQLGELQHL
jgi:hypothetical protein